MYFIGSENSKNAELYTETNRKGEKISKIAFAVIAIAIPILFIFPNVIVVYLIYFTTDLGSEAFVVLYDVW